MNSIQPWPLIQFLSLHYTPNESTSKMPLTQITHGDITGFSCNWFLKNNLTNTLNGLPKKCIGSFFLIYRVQFLSLFFYNLMWMAFVSYVSEIFH